MLKPYKECFDAATGMNRRVFSLDDIRLKFLSEFSRGGAVVKYSIDIEAAEDSHYEIDAGYTEVLAKILKVGADTDSLVEGLTLFFQTRTMSYLEKRFKARGIKYSAFHYYDYDD